MSNDTLTVEIWRGREDGRFDTFEVPRMASQTVLDIVTYVQRNLDPGLSYRFACRVGVCGSCAMTVNGKPRGPAAPMSTRSPMKAPCAFSP